MTIAFLQDNWDTFGLRMLIEFHSTGEFAKRVNATLSGLITKKSGVRDIIDHQPINLVGFAYNLFLKGTCPQTERRHGKFNFRSSNVQRCPLDVCL